MRSLFQINILACLLVLLLCDQPTLAQANLLDLFPDRKKEWQRISTDADSTVDVNTSSLVLESNGRLRATYRFRLSKEEKAFEKPGAKYKTRLETIQFDTRERTYRIVETTLLDSAGGVVYASGFETTRAWKPLNSVTASRFYRVAVELPPLGAWSVVAARYPDGTTVPPDDTDQDTTPQPRSLVSTRIEKFEVGRRGCSAPTYESSTLRAEEFAKWTGFSLKEAGFTTDQVDAIKIKCESPNLVSETHVLLVASANRAKLLSGGILLDLEKLQY